MKNTALAIAMLLTSMLSAQQLKEDDVPMSVRSAYKSLYGEPAHWSKGKYGMYAADFREKGEEATATFDGNGLLQRTAYKVNKKDIPQKVREDALKLKPGYKLNECYRIKTPDKKLLYEVTIYKDKDTLSYVYDSNYDFLREKLKGLDNVPDDGSGK